MSPQANAELDEPSAELNLFCSLEGEVWRVHVRPTKLPRYLQHCFDEHGEAFPVLLDFDDLARHMAASEATFEKRVSRTGGVELLARGDAASALAVWLSTAFASGVRPGARPSVPDAG
jgi:hypothetical protein